MTPEEAVLLIAQVRAGWPQVSIVAGMDTAWHRALEDLDAEDCELAVVELSKVSEKPPQPANIRNMVRTMRESTAQREVAAITLRNDGSRHRMPSWFRTVYEASRAENAGKYRAIHEARRAKEKEEGKPLNAFQPFTFGQSMPGFFGGGERSPQERAAGPDS